MTDRQLDLPLWRDPAIRRLMLVSACGSVSFNLMLASVPLRLVSSGSSESAAGLPTAVMLAVTVVAQMAMPALTGRFGAGRVLALGMVALGLPAPLYAITGHLWVLLLAAGVRGCGFAAWTVIASTMTATLAPPGRHGESVGMYGLATAAPSLLGVPLGVALTEAGGFVAVSVLATVAAFAAPIALKLRPGGSSSNDPAAVRDEPNDTHRSAITSALAPSLVLLTVTLAGGGVTTFLPVARPSGHLAAVSLLVLAIGTVLSRWRVGRLVDRLGSRNLLPVTVVCAVVGLSVIEWGLVAGAAGDFLVPVGAGLLGVGYGSVQNLTLVLAFARAGRRRMSTASAVWNAFFDAGTAIGAALVGQVAATGLGLPRSFGLTGVVVALTLPLCWWLRGSNRRNAVVVSGPHNSIDEQ